MKWMLFSALMMIAAVGCQKENNTPAPSTTPNPQTQPQENTMAPAQPVPSANPRVALATSKGKIVIELDLAKAPVTVENFLAYVRDGFYAGTIFHRVIPGFMIQGGGFDTDMQQKDTRAPIVNEAKNGLKNLRGTIAMARTSNPNSATAQFFINVNGNTASLDYAPGNPGYAVFGKVVEGMDVADAIVSAPTTSKGPYQNVPVTPILIEKAEIVE